MFKYNSMVSGASVVLEVSIVMTPMDDLPVMPDREMLAVNNGGVIQGFGDLIIDLQRHGYVAVGFNYRIGGKP